MAMSICVLHVSNISPFATEEQIQTLFAYVGRIEEFKLYPSDFIIAQTSQQPKVAYIKFEDESGVDVGQHLTNTIFLDRALVCIPTTSNSIPDEETALQCGSLALPGQRQLASHISNQVQDIGDRQKMKTIDERKAKKRKTEEKERGDRRREKRRSKSLSMSSVLHVSNISPFATEEQIQTLFAYVGRIEEFKLYPSDYIIAQTSQQPKVAYIKFEDESGVDVGQHLTNTIFLDRALVCIPTTSNSIPDEETALQCGSIALPGQDSIPDEETALQCGSLLLPGQRQLASHISDQVQDIGDRQKMKTIDERKAKKRKTEEKERGDRRRKKGRSKSRENHYSRERSHSRNRKRLSRSRSRSRSRKDHRRSRSRDRKSSRCDSSRERRRH